MSSTPSAVALIGARAGSERVPGKNVRRLAGHPLLAYAIETARQADVFERIVVSTDSETDRLCHLHIKDVESIFTSGHLGEKATLAIPDA